MYKLPAALFLTVLLAQPLQAAPPPASKSTAQAQPSNLPPADRGQSDTWTYRNPAKSFSQYNAFIIEPTIVSSGAAAQWDGVTPEDRLRYATILTNSLRTEVAKAYTIAKRPGQGVATMRLTLLGMKQTKKAIATASKVTPMGLAFNAVKSVAGKEGSFSGYAHVALEITDAQSGELLFAAIRRRAPDALDIEASLSTPKTVAAIARELGEDVRKGIDRAHGPK